MAQNYTPSNLLWQDFLTLVTGLMGLEGQRTGSGVETLRGLCINQGVMLLQTVIDQYRVNHETVYQPQDLVAEGNASRGVKPPQSVIRSVFLAKTCNDQCTGTARCTRWDTDPWAWADRFALVQGKVAVNNNRGLFCPDPQGYTFYVYPEVFDCWLLSIHWDGLKVDFNPLDETPFDELMAGTVALYAKAQVAMEADHDHMAYDTFMRKFESQKKLCGLREREKTEAKG
jgi:hypothetical protein